MPRPRKDTRQWRTVAQVAETHGVTARAVRYWCERGLVYHERRGIRYWFILTSGKGHAIFCGTGEVLPD